MWGSADDPPTQWPHRDSVGDRHPVFTALYYPLVANVQGGRLILHEVPQGQVMGIEPVSDLLLIIEGNQVHSVEPLTAGERVTVVTNFYVDPSSGKES